MIVSVPAAIPVTIPVVNPTVALVLLQFQLPPVTASLSSVVAPIHTFPAPVIGYGSGFTVTTFVTMQPVPIE